MNEYANKLILDERMVTYLFNSVCSNVQENEWSGRYCKNGRDIQQIVSQYVDHRISYMCINSNENKKTAIK